MNQIHIFHTFQHLLRNPNNVLYASYVRLVRFELTRIFQHQFLKLARLPLLHRRNFRKAFYFHSRVYQFHHTSVSQCSGIRTHTAHSSRNYSPLTLLLLSLFYILPFAKVGCSSNRTRTDTSLDTYFWDRRGYQLHHRAKYSESITRTAKLFFPWELEFTD